MKEKLQKVKELLICDAKFWSGIASGGGNPKYAQITYEDYLKIQQVAPFIDSILAELDSPELIGKVAEVINNSHPLHAEKWNTIANLSECDGYMNAKNIVRNTRIQAKATIEAIKE